MNWRIAAIFALAAFVPLLTFYWLPNFLLIKRETAVFIGGQKILVEVAKTEGERRRGLSGREFLGKNEGMLFLFSSKDIYSFWMKGMKFDLDFVFIEGQRVVYLAENIPFPKGEEKPTFVRSKEEFDAVLEINAGSVQKLGVKIGDEAAFLLK